MPKQICGYLEHASTELKRTVRNTIYYWRNLRTNRHSASTIDHIVLEVPRQLASCISHSLSVAPLPRIPCVCVCTTCVWVLHWAALLPFFLSRWKQEPPWTCPFVFVFAAEPPQDPSLFLSLLLASLCRTGPACSAAACPTTGRGAKV